MRSTFQIPCLFELDKESPGQFHTGKLELLIKANLSNKIIATPENMQELTNIPKI